MANSETDHLTLLYYVNLIVTFLSLGASYWMSYFCLKSYHASASLKLILCIGINDFFFSISNLMSSLSSHNTVICYTEAVLRQFTSVLALFFASCTAVLCYKTMKLAQNFDQQRFFKKILVIGPLICICYNIS